MYSYFVQLQNFSYFYSYAKKTTIFILDSYSKKKLPIKNKNIQRLIYIYMNYYSPYL